jgi:hypothetical protein
VTTVPAEEMARLLTTLRDQYGGSVDALLVAAEKGVSAGGRRRRLPEPVQLRTAGEVLEAVRMKLVNREEGRRLLGLRATRSRARSPRAVGSGPVQDGGVGDRWRASA